MFISYVSTRNKGLKELKVTSYCCCGFVMKILLCANNSKYVEVLGNRSIIYGYKVHLLFVCN